MLLDIDYENWIRQNSSSEKAAEYRMANVQFLLDALKNTLERDEDGELTIEDAIAKLVLRDMLVNLYYIIVVRDENYGARLVLDADAVARLLVAEVSLRMQRGEGCRQKQRKD